MSFCLSKSLSCVLLCRVDTDSHDPMMLCVCVWFQVWLCVYREWWRIGLRSERTSPAMKPCLPHCRCGFFGRCPKPWPLKRTSHSSLTCLNLFPHSHATPTQVTSVRYSSASSPRHGHKRHLPLPTILIILVLELTSGLGLIPVTPPSPSCT
jgi:hypothetical protein